MKRGSAILGQKPIYYAIATIILAAMFLFFRAEIQNNLVDQTICLEDVENKIIMSEALYSEDCFAYYDTELDKTIPGTIDLSKFTEENLDNNCFQFIKRRVQIKLEDQTIGDAISNPDIISRIVYVYNNGQTNLTTMEFYFPEQQC